MKCDLFFLLYGKPCVCVLDLNLPVTSAVTISLMIVLVYEQSISDHHCHLILFGPRSNFLLHTVIQQGPFADPAEWMFSILSQAGHLR